jgi:hypothetical protein
VKCILTAFLIAFAAAFVVSAAEPEPGDFVVEKLSGIVIPVIHFEDTSFEEAIDFIRLRSVELDPEDDPARRGISFVIISPAKSPDGGPGKIEHYHAKDVPLPVALAEICRVSGFDAYITSCGIVICPRGQAPFPNSKSEKGEIWKKLTEPKPEPAGRK